MLSGDEVFALADESLKTSLEDAGVEVHPVSKIPGRPRELAVYHALRRIPRVDALVSMTGAIPPSAPPTAYFAQQALPFHAQIRQEYRAVWRLRLRAHELYLRNAASRASLVWTQTRAMAELLLRCIPALGSDKTLVRRPPLPWIPSGGDFRGGPTRLLHIGGSHPYKRSHSLLAVWPSVSTAVPDASLTVIGLSGASDGPYDRPDGETLTFRTDVSRLEMRELYSEADVLVVTSIVESLGFPLLEGLSAGLSIVAPRLPYTQEVLGDAATYYNSTSQADLAERLAGHLRSPSTVAANMSAAASRARSKFPSVAEYGEFLHADLLRLIDGHRGGLRGWRPS